MKAENQAPRETKPPFHPDFSKKDLNFIALFDQLQIYFFLISVREIIHEEEKSLFSSQEVVSLSMGEISHL